MKLVATAAAFLIAVPAFISSAPTGEPDMIKRESYFNYDDSDEFVAYHGHWTRLSDQGYELWDKTETYTGQANA